MELDILKQILVDVLSVDESEIFEESTLMGDLGADSLDAYQIVLKLEEEFDVTFDAGEVEQVETVGDALSLIQSKISD